MTAMSERALIYLDEPLAHRTLVLYEAAALREGPGESRRQPDRLHRPVAAVRGPHRYPVVTRDDDGSSAPRAK